MSAYSITKWVTIHSGDAEREEDRYVEIDYDFERGRPATMYDRHGDPGSPAEPCEVEITACCDAKTGEDLLSALDVDYYEGWLLDNHYD